ncbi:hypothetical protein EVAR_74484_1 [Eumeta japonica]|uniref:Uncharacterized protein n=1 Tax=Eumeta variegata TaxID=151549 RepID=A0A4C1TCJ9_EUMVA|nr:hypothetical protein EVAR_74484_1 [Eumeta japonica]
MRVFANEQAIYQRVDSHRHSLTLNTYNPRGVKESPVRFQALRGERAYEPSENRWSSPCMDTRNTRGVISSTISTSWVAIGCLTEVEWGDEGGPCFGQLDCSTKTGQLKYHTVTEFRREVTALADVFL